MSETTVDIERVVREVLAELGALKAANGTGSASGTRPESSGDRGQASGARPSEISNLKSEISNLKSEISNPQSPIPNPPSPGELVVNSRVVTMEEIAGRLGAGSGTGLASGTRRVLVSRKAVVTPAVRDELIRRGITLGYFESSNGDAATAIRLAMMTTGTDFDPTALVAGLTREGLRVEHTASDCIIASSEQLAAEVARPDTLGVLLTRHTAAGLCLANRLSGVRAVTGVDAPSVAAAAAAVGANVLVADPRAGTFFQLKQIVTEFCRGGVHACPGVFRAQLA